MSAEIRSGTLVAGFRVDRVVGAGAMGTVFVAEDLRSGARVALKILAPELARDTRFRDRFLRESQIAAQLDHPNVTPTIAAGEHEGLLYLAMAYVDGPDLREVLRREARLEPERAVALVAQVASALDAAHRAGLVHRDVKPGNILVASEPDGEHAYLCDFGLARHVSSVSSLTGERGFVGTIDYVPPEQIEGGQIDGRADVYSLGCVLFECLAGERPFDRDSELSTVFAHLNDPPPRVSDVRADLPAAFDDVIASALAKAPDERFATAGALSAAAQAALRGKSIVRRRSARRRALMLALVGIIAATAATVIVATRGGKSHAAQAAIPLKPNAVNLISAKTHRVVAHVPLGKRASTQFASFDVARDGRFAWVLDAPDRALARIDLATRRRDRDVRLPWSPSDRIAVGGGIVWARRNGAPQVVGIDARTGRVVRRFSVPGNGVGIAFGDGSLWLAQGDGVARVDPRTGRLLHRITVRPGQEGQQTVLAFADGGLFSGNDDGDVLRIDPSSDQIVARNTVSGSISDMAVGGGSVWLSVIPDDRIFELGEDDLAVGTTRPGGLDPERLSLGGPSLWIANTLAPALSSITAANDARRRFATVARPATATYARGLVIVAATAPPAPLPPIKGEDIRISSSQDELDSDPQMQTNVVGRELAYITCATLLGYPDANGAAGASLEPEVAAAMPTISAGGRTYTFRIRDGFRFSPPANEPITAGTFKRSIERALSKPFAGFGDAAVGDIVGEGAFQSGRAAHISGVVARGDTLRITLVKPSGSFLARISIPAFCPVSSTTPMHPVEFASDAPRSGRYYVSSVAPGRTVLLPNPNYGGNRPRRPARIVFESGTPSPQAVALANAGKLDYLPPDYNDDRLLGVQGPLDRRYGPGTKAARAGDQRYLHLSSGLVNMLVLNSGEPLFRDERLRRAVAFAIDRTRLADDYGRDPTDSLVPAAVPGFGPLGMYPLRPDLSRARALAGRRSRNATLYYCNNGPFGGSGQEHLAALVRAELEPIGIRVTVSAPPCAPDSRYDANARHADIVLAAMFNPIPDPEPFLSQFEQKGSLGAALGPGLWTQPAFLARLRTASKVVGARRNVVYRQLEKDVLNAAPVVPFGTYYEGHYLSPHVGCRVVPPGPNVVDLALLCKH